MTPYKIDQPLAYIHFLEKWIDNLPLADLAQIAAAPRHCAIISVDVIKGFCTIGPLSSPRVAAIVKPIAGLLQKAWDLQIHHIVFLQDTHEPDAVEFGSYPPHCVRGTEEAETVDELRSLPFFSEITIMEKNSISSELNTGLNDWLTAHPDLDTFIVVGDCTDLCTYQLAMHLRLDANARQLNRRVIVPVDCVDTYDIPVEKAAGIGAVPHPATFIHAVFLHNMHLNGIEVFKLII
jgi:nicotinamidase-related amidase